MKKLELKIDRSTFSLLWMSLHARENELLRIVDQYSEDSDEGADALNDIVALRLYKKELKEQAENIFDKNAFILEDIPLPVEILRLV